MRACLIVGVLLSVLSLLLLVVVRYFFLSCVVVDAFAG